MHNSKVVNLKSAGKSAYDEQLLLELETLPLSRVGTDAELCLMGITGKGIDGNFVIKFRG